MSHSEADLKIVQYRADENRTLKQPEEEIDETNIDLRDLFHKIWQGRWLILTSLVACLVLAILAVSQMEPKYTASAKVMFNTSRSNILDLQEILIDAEFGDESLQNEIEVLRSTGLIERVVDELYLDKDPQLNPVLWEKESILSRLTEAVPQLGSAVNALREVGILKEEIPDLGPVQLARLGRELTVATVLNRIRLDPIDGSQVIQITFTTNDPLTSARTVNAVASQYVADQLETKLETAQFATGWLTSRVDDLRQRVQASDEAVETLKAELSAAAGQSIEMTQQQLGSLGVSLSVARNEVSEIESQYQRISGALESGQDLRAIIELRNSPFINEYLREERSLARQLGSFSETHPIHSRLQGEIETIRLKIRDEAESILAATELNLSAARSKVKSLETTVQTLEASAFEQSREGAQLREMEREAEASRLLYESFLKRLKETSVQEDLLDAKVRVLSPARPPLYPDNSSKQKIVIMAAVLGCLIGGGLIFLLEHLNNTFRSPGHVEELTGEPVLAAIPLVGSRLKKRDTIGYLRERPNSALAESIRNLRTSILFSNVDKPPKVVMFTSSVPQEGKSTTSLLTAITSCQMGKSAIIVDCDLRLPSVAGAMSAEKGRPGLLSVLEGSINIDEAVHIDPETGLHVLASRSGERTANISAADVLSSARFRNLIATLREKYDLVVLDTPPALIVTDARILSSLADAVIYAVRWNHTPRGAVIEGLKELRSVQAPVAGVVLSMFNENKASKFSYKGYKSYKSKHGGYYVG